MVWKLCSEVCNFINFKNVAKSSSVRVDKGGGQMREENVLKSM